MSFAFIISYSQQAIIEVSVYSALFISALSIYNIDHLVDANKLGVKAKSYRHSFYQKNKKKLLSWQFILAVVGIVIVFYLPLKVFWGGVGLLILIGLYFWIIFSFTNSNWIFREVIVAFGYTLAVAFVPVINGGLNLSLNFVWVFSIIFLIALSNLWVFSLYDVEVDRNHNHHSISSTINILNLKKMIGAVLILTILSTIGYSLYYHFWILGGALIITELAYLFLLVRHPFFNRNEYYRLIGETVLILPGIILLLSNAI